MTRTLRPRPARQPRRRLVAPAAATLVALSSLAACSSEPDAAPTTAHSSVSPPASAASPSASRPVLQGAPGDAGGTPSAQPGGSDLQAVRTAPVTVAFGGDVHFEGFVRARLDNPGTAFGPITRVLSQADVAVVNLETAITTRGRPEPKRFTFRAPATAFDALRAAGVDVASLANNHGVDFGPVGLRDTLAAARRAGYPLIGVGEDDDAAYAPHRVTVNGQRLAFIGASQVIDGVLQDTWTAGPDQPGLASAYTVDRLTAAVRATRRDADTVIVYLHWGTEREACATQRQRELADALVDAGADVIVGTHAHVLLGGGWHPGSSQGAYVDYGLGNFVWYARGVKPATESGVLTLTIDGRRTTAARWTPARITGGVPVPVSGRDGERIADRKAALRRCTDLRATPPR